MQTKNQAERGKRDRNAEVLANTETYLSFFGNEIPKAEIHGVKPYLLYHYQAR
jgi:hypothetical protein